MNDDVLVVQELRERLAADEPSLLLVLPGVIRERGRQKLRRRRMAASAAAAVAVAAVAVGSALTTGGSGDARPPVPPVEHPRQFDPGVLTSAIDRAVHAGGAPWEQRKLEARGEPARPLIGAARDAARQWQATYTAGDGHALEIWLVYEKPFDEAAVREQCADDARFNDRCEVLSSTATSITQLTERVTYDDAGNWPVLEDGVANLVGPIPVERRWYMRTVKDFRFDGLIVMAREMVHAPTVSEAEPLWLESTGSLTAISTDPELWFPPFPGALEQGDRSGALDDLAEAASEQAAALATAMPCDPSVGFPEPRESCPDADPETAWLSARGQDLTLQPFHSYTNDAEGEAYAQANGLEYPYSNDTLDAAEGAPHSLELAPDTVCTGSIVVSRQVTDQVVDCAQVVEAAAERRLAVAIWRQDGAVVQVSELYRP